VLSKVRPMGQPSGYGAEPEATPAEPKRKARAKALKAAPPRDAESEAGKGDEPAKPARRRGGR
jgi:hypothetical protein